MGKNSRRSSSRSRWRRFRHNGCQRRRKAFCDRWPPSNRCSPSSARLAYLPKARVLRLQERRTVMPGGRPLLSDYAPAFLSAFEMKRNISPSDIPQLGSLIGECNSAHFPPSKSLCARVRTPRPFRQSRMPTSLRLSKISAANLAESLYILVSINRSNIRFWIVSAQM